MKFITRGLGPGKQAIIAKDFGGLVYYLKGWVSLFKKGVIDWATKLDPEQGIDREESFAYFESDDKALVFEIFPRSIEFVRDVIINSIERLLMATGVFHAEIVDSFERRLPVSMGIDKREPIYGIEHSVMARETECLDRSRIFDEVHEFFETSQL